MHILSTKENEIKVKPEDQWSCKRSPDIWAYCKYTTKFRQILRFLKMGQCQLRVIIYINFAELVYILLHAKFHDNRTISSVGDFLKFFSTINEHGVHLGHVTCFIHIDFLSHFPRRLHMIIVFDKPSSFREENV